MIGHNNERIDRAKSQDEITKPIEYKTWKCHDNKSFTYDLHSILQLYKQILSEILKFHPLRNCGNPCQLQSQILLNFQLVFDLKIEYVFDLELGLCFWKQ